MPKLAIIGTTTWGLTLGTVLAAEDHEVRVWTRTEEEAVRLTQEGPQTEPFEGITLPPQLTFTSSMEEALDGAKAVILVVPSQSMRQNLGHLKAHLKKSTLIVSAAKGLELGSNKRMSQVIAEEIDPGLWGNICVLSGPNLAREILRGLPAVTVVAAWTEPIANKAQRLLNTKSLCVYTNGDVVGVELGGALKNIIALGAGMVDGLECGDNAKAAFITRGLTEITALGVALGANPLTLAGLAGLGDLITTCASPLSRNHYVGVELTKGRPLKKILASMDSVAEGVGTTAAAWSLSQQLGLEMPLTEKIYNVLYGGLDPRQGAEELMGAKTKHELVGRKWGLFSLFRRKHKESEALASNR